MHPWNDPEFKLKTYNFKGSLLPFQHGGAAFLSLVKKCLLTDRVGLGKTVQTIAAFDVLKNKYPDLKLVVLTLKSVQRQWLTEFAKFLPDALVGVVPSDEGKQGRMAAYSAFKEGLNDVLILSYGQLLKDLGLDNPNAYFGFTASGPLAQAIKDKKYVLILDEIQKCKNVSSLTSKCCKYLADAAHGVKGLTATPIYNQLIDIYGLFKVIEPKLFKNKAAFENDFCIKDYRFNQYGDIVGYKNHQKLKDLVSPYMLGRDKKDVAKDLPPFLYKDYFVDLPKEHKRIYKRIEDGAVLDAAEAKTAVGEMAAFVRAQVAANALEHVSDYTGKPSHPKIDEAVRLVSEELQGEKIIIFSQFEKTISLLQKVFKRDKIPFFRLTGKEGQLDRETNQISWQNEPSTSVLGITTAGEAGLNLQAASTIVFIDRPWSVGKLEQIRGRLHRIGSKHSTLLEINIVAEDTIDYDVILSLREKGKNVKKVFGEGDLPVTSSELINSIRKRQNAKIGKIDTESDAGL